jgi:SAM-dependent methyltransferase
MCLDSGLEDAAAALASTARDVTGIERSDLMKGVRLSVRVEALTAALHLKPGEATICPVHITNASTVAFHGGDCATELTYHLLEADGTVLRFENPIRVVFEEPLYPGETRVVDLWVRAPSASGLYYVELDLLWAGLIWLNTIDDHATFIKLLVGAHKPRRGWRLHVGPDHVARLITDAARNRARVSIDRISSATAWDVQLNLERFFVAAHESYVLEFDARSDDARTAAVAVSQAHDPWDGLGLYHRIELNQDWQTFTLEFEASASDDRARVHFDIGAAPSSVEVRSVQLHMKGCLSVEPPPFGTPGRNGMDIGIQPLSGNWGNDRGLPVHRHYLEAFLARHAGDISGRVLEFQDPQYTPRFGGAAVSSVEILHKDASNPRATLIGDLTGPNTLPGEAFDCIVCTHVLHVISNVHRAIRELRRLLRVGGVLLIAVPHVSMAGPEYDEIWRFTPHGLRVLLATAFAEDEIDVEAFGNSLTAAGEIRGVVAEEFTRQELQSHDPRFAVEVCARVVRRR